MPPKKPSPLPAKPRMLTGMVDDNFVLSRPGSNEPVVAATPAAKPIPKRTVTTKRAHAIHPFFLSSALLLSLSFAAALIPKNRELVERLMRDGDSARAYELAEDGQLEVAAKAIMVTPQNKEAEQAEAISRLDYLLGLTPPAEGKQLGDAIRCIVDTDRSAELVRKQLPILDRGRLEATHMALADSALANSNPAGAAEFLRELQKKGFRHENLVRRLVQTLRWSNQPAAACQVLQDWGSKHTMPEDLRKESIELLQAVNKSDAALEQLLPELASDGPIPKERLELGIVLAARSRNIGKVIPFVQKALAQHPEHQATLSDLHTGKLPISTEWKDLAGKFAQGCEWGGEQNKAFDVHLKLAATGDRASLERVLKLNPGLNRKGDVMNLLRTIRPVADRPELEPLTAQLLADSGQYREAETVYQEWLAKNPQDVPRWMELAATYDEMSEMDKSLAIYEQVLVLEPRNLSARKEKADILIGMKKFQDALDVYKRFKADEHDPFTLENYALLAESLADYGSRARALEMRHKLLPKPTTKDYYDLVRSLLVLEKGDAALRYLDEGRKRYPDSRMLWLTTARTYTTLDRPEDTLAVLTTARTKTDMEAMMLYIDTAAVLEQYSEAYQFIGNGVENRFAFGPETLLPLSSIYFHNGQLSLARRLLENLSGGDPSLWPLMAKTYFQQASYEHAEKFQRRYLDTLRVEDAPAWVMLGDICKVQGKHDEAKRAYDRALRVMDQKMSNALNEQASAAPAKPASDQPH